jgi:hypothetical protein
LAQVTPPGLLASYNTSASASTARRFSAAAFCSGVAPSLVGIASLQINQSVPGSGISQGPHRRRRYLQRNTHSDPLNASRNVMPISADFQ